MAVETKATIGGQIIGLLFGLPASEYIQSKIIGLLDEKEKEITFNLMQMVEIIYGGYLNWCRAENQDPSVPYRAFYDFVDDSATNDKMDEVVRIVTLFGNSKKVKDKPGKDTEPEDDEKKSQSRLTGTKLKRSA